MWDGPVCSRRWQPDARPSLCWLFFLEFVPFALPLQNLEILKPLLNNSTYNTKLRSFLNERG